MQTQTVADSRVLVVEDDQVLRTVIADALREDGYAVDAAADGHQALELARLAPPDLVILDLMMPYIDGEAFSNELRQIEGLDSTPILLVSASRRVEEVGARIGAEVALRKPFDLFELTDRVNQLLG
jgi:DNA-binding response OmpR family regulator